MPGIHIDKFGGIRPAISERALDPGRAQVAHNTVLRDGSIIAVKEPRLLRHEGFTVRAIYKPGDTHDCCTPVLAWDHCVSVIDMPDPGDYPGYKWVVAWHHECNPTYGERINACTGETYPLVVFGPRTAPITTITGQGTMATAFVCEKDSGCNEYKGPDERSYVYTWVDRFGVESRPSPASLPILAYDDQTITVGGFEAPPSNAVAVRIYRTTSPFTMGENPSTNYDTSFQLVEEIDLPLPGNIYVDDKRLADICWGTLLTIENCDPPPCMDQVVMTESGYAVGFYRNQIYVSERYEPHNWPEKNRLELPDRIVGLAVNYDMVYIGTTGRPYRMNVAFTRQGSDADVTVDPVPYNERWPCLQQQAITATAFGAAYVSREGIVGLRPTGAAQLLSYGRMDEDRWLEYAPNLLTWHQGRLFGVRSPAGNGVVFDLPESTGSQVDLGDLVTVDLDAQVLHAGRDGHLYFGDGRDVFTYNEGFKPLEFRWRSRVFDFPGLTALGAAKVVADYGLPLTMRLYASGRLVYERTLYNSAPVRLPPFGRHIPYVVEITGRSRVHEIHLGVSIGDLAEK